MSVKQKKKKIYTNPTIHVNSLYIAQQIFFNCLHLLISCKFSFKEVRLYSKVLCVFLFLVLRFIIHNFFVKHKYELKYKLSFIAINDFTVYLVLSKIIYKFLLFQNITQKISNMTYIEKLLN